MSDTVYKMMNDYARFWQEALIIDRPDWHSPREKVFESDALILWRFNPDSDAAPFLILPPQAGHHSAIADYGPGQSLVRLVAETTGAGTYAVEWKSATYARRNEGIDDLVLQTKECVKALGGWVNLIRLCQGGWLSTVYTALSPCSVRTLTLAGSPIDFHSGGGAIEKIARMYPMNFFESLVALGGGVLWGGYMIMGFKNLNPYELYFKTYVDLYCDILAGNEKKLARTKRFRTWYEYPQNIAGAWYLEAVQELFKKNKLIKNELVVLGQKVELSRIDCLLTLIGGGGDHITRPEQVLNTARYVSTQKDEINSILIPDCGHIGLFIKKNALEQYWKKALLRLV